MKSVEWNNRWRTYLGCFYPVLAIVALLLVLFALSAILQVEKPRFPSPELTPLAGYPDNISLEEAALIVETGLKWLSFTYFYWLVGLVSIGFCFLKLHKAAIGCAPTIYKWINALLSASIVITIGLLIYYAVARETPLMSFEFLLRNLQQMGQGLVDMTTYNSALSYVTIVALLVTICLLLIPEVHGNDEVKQIRAITQLMYCAAAFLLVWIVQATEMYRFAATLLVQEERDLLLKLASTISLMAGLFASLLLAAAYMAAYHYLQFRHRTERKDVGTVPSDSAQSPKNFLLAHWPKITAVLMPVLPGAINTVLNLLAQPI
jgi:hypothetical protein